MDDDLFPSGPWTGFYHYTGPEDRHRMDLHLTFANGRMTGEGTDDVGPFLIRGRYDTASRECQWTKTYPGSHEVLYRGFREGTGIWGLWEIPPWSKGGFHIWPRRLGNGAHEKLAAGIGSVSEKCVEPSTEVVGVSPSPGAVTLEGPRVGIVQRSDRTTFLRPRTGALRP